MRKLLLLLVVLAVVLSTCQAADREQSMQTLVRKLQSMNLHMPTLMELQAHVTQHLHAGNSSSATTSFAPSASSKNPFADLLNQFRGVLVDHQVSAAAQANNETATCNKQAKELARDIASLNNTLVKTTSTIDKQKDRIVQLKDKVQSIVLKLDPKVKELEGIVAAIQTGFARRASQQKANKQKLDQTQQMIDIIAKLSQDLSSQSQFKFRETVASLQSQVTDESLQRFLQTTLNLLAAAPATTTASSTPAPATSSTPAPATSPAAVTADNIAKLRQLLVLLDAEMKEYKAQITSAENSAKVAWTKVLGTYQSQRLLIQGDVTKSLNVKSASIAEIDKLQSSVDKLKDSLLGLPEKLAVLSPQYAAMTQDCATKARYFSAEAASRNDQLKTLDAINKLASALEGSAAQQVLAKLTSKATAPPTEAPADTPAK